MPINYPISSGGSSGNATQIQGKNVSSETPKNFSKLMWFTDQNKYVFDNSNIFPIFTGKTSVSGSTQTHITSFKFFGGYGSTPPNQNAYFILNASITNPYTGSIAISSSEGQTVYQVANSNFSFIFPVPISGANTYDVYASSSDDLGIFSIFRILSSYELGS